MSQENRSRTRFHVQTSDVLQDLRVNVSLEGSSEVIWHKERFLDDKEIIENLVHNATNTICWTIHRPLRGWYIRIRSPMFPPGVFIPLTPVPSSAPYHTEAAMSFNSRTNIPVIIQPKEAPPSESPSELSSEDVVVEPGPSQPSSSSGHSYPPPSSTPPPPQPPSATSELQKRPVSLIPASQITQFILSPSSSSSSSSTQINSETEGDSSSFFSRALSMLKTHRPSRSNSFILSRVLHPPKRDGVSSPPPPYRSNAASYSVENVIPAALPAPFPESGTAALGHYGQSQPVLNTPLLFFQDQTPLLTLRSLTGLIEVNQVEERTLGVDTSFWIAIALTYLEFLEERESYLAAVS